HVVEMSVCEQNCAGNQIGTDQEFAQWLGGILARIDDDTLLRVVLREDVAIGLEHPGRESGHEHVHRSYGCKRSRSSTDHALRPFLPPSGSGGKLDTTSNPVTPHRSFTGGLLQWRATHS